MGGRPLLKGGAAVLLVVSLIAATLYAESLNERARLGQQVPDFVLASVDGEEVALAELQGQPLVINFWNEWCEECASEAPHLEEAAAAFQGQVRFVGINRGDLPVLRDAYIEKHGLTYLQLWDSRTRVAQRFNVTGVPETFFVDAQGILRFKWIGPMDPDDLWLVTYLLYADPEELQRLSRS